MFFKSPRTLPKRKTKIVATIGPSSNSSEIIRELIIAGMDVARLNFSHGSHHEHSIALEIVRDEAKKLGKPVAVFQDLSGPKVRIGDLQDGRAILEEGKKIELRHFKGETGNKDAIYVEAFRPSEVMLPGHKALLSDGQIELVAEKVDSEVVLCTVKSGGSLRSRSGIAVPDSKLKLACLTDKDLKDVKWGVEKSIDFIALSFVGSSRDIIDLKDKLKSHGKKIPIIAKIERADCLDDLDNIIDISDAAMVARGDLGLELPLERVPTVQKQIIETGQNYGTPIIVATQMLMSMVNNLRPTRAEVSDVCTAVRDGAAAVMLSDETAIGKHPVQAIQMLDRIVLEAENEAQRSPQNLPLRDSDKEIVTDSICYAACGAAEKISASAIVACTQSGYTAKLVSKYRPKQTLFGATSEPHVLARMALYWGVVPLFIEIDEKATTEEEVSQALIEMREQFGIKPGARIVVTAGLRTKKTGMTNVLEIREIPRSLSQTILHQAKGIFKGN